MGLYLDGAIVTLPLLGTFAAVEGRFVACWDANAFVFAQSIRLEETKSYIHYYSYMTS
jgi:hypothetical protein